MTIREGESSSGKMMFETIAILATKSYLQLEYGPALAKTGSLEVPSDP